MMNNRTQIMIFNHLRMTLIFLIFLIGLLVGCDSGEGVEVEAETAVSAATSTSEARPTDEPSPTPQPTPTAETTVMPATGGEANANVEYVRAVETAVNEWTFHVTVAHPDTGWDDYADGWDVVLPDGTVLLPNPENPFTRLLLHPHETEQPFTRSQSNIEIPEGITAVTVRAHDIVDGFGGVEITVDLNQASGDNYEVQRLNE